jgi:pimeloyl-ACP methyl ester carboxylesterase
LALCLHGFPEHAISWRHQLPMLAALGYRAWAPNQRGYGGTTRPVRVSDYTIDKLMADVAGLIDASGARSTVLIAHDWGAFVAWCFAARRVRPLDALIILNVPHPARYLLSLRHWRQLKKSWYVLFFQLPGLPERLLGRDAGRALRDLFVATGGDPARFPPDVLEVYRRAALEPGALTAMLNWYRAAGRGSLLRAVWRGLPRIDVRTLMIWGARDVALDPITTRGTGRHVRELTLRTLPEASHWVQQDAPETVNAMIAAFLAGAPVPDRTG